MPDSPRRELHTDVTYDKFCVPKAQFFIHTTRLTWALDLPRPPAAAAASAGHGLQFRHLVRRCVVKSLRGCSGNRQVLRLYQEGVRSGRSEGEEDATATSTLAASRSPCIDTIHKYSMCL